MRKIHAQDIERHVWKYNYWSKKYRALSQLTDLQQRNIAFDQLMQEAQPHKRIAQKTLQYLKNLKICFLVLYPLDSGIVRTKLGGGGKFKIASDEIA